MGALVELPLFPLQAVLIPGMSMPLHVFEPRYKQLLADCQAADHRFGVVLIRQGHEVGATAVPFEVGTIARIISVASLPGGTFKVEVVGHERFRIHNLRHDRPYLWCNAEILDDPLGDPEQAQAAAVQVRALLSRFVDAMDTGMDQGTQHLPMGLPDDSLALSFAAAMLLHLPDAETQALLEAPTIAERLSLEVDVLRRELAILRHMLQNRSSGDDSGKRRHSIN